MDVLLTSSRLPFALEEIRKLGRAGHRVYAADSFFSAPGSRSRHAARAFVIASPRYQTARFLDDLETILRNHPVDYLLPAFEDVFYIALHRTRFERHTRVFAPSFATLRQLHDKTRFLALAKELGLAVPKTIVATSRDELERATREIGSFFARPAYTRGGVTLFTNVGPLAGRLQVAECAPTPENPFLVQPFVEGEDVCTFSVAHEGRVAAHVAYEHPLRLEHAGGIVFQSVDAEETLELVRPIIEATGYDGQISFDFLRTRNGLVPVECNPRPTAGLAVMPDEMLSDALIDRHPDRTLLAPAGMQRKLSLALLRNAILGREDARASLRTLFSTIPDLYADRRDLLPLLFQFIAYGHVLAYRLEQGRVSRTDLMQGYFHDLCWDGDLIDGQNTSENVRAFAGRPSS